MSWVHPERATGAAFLVSAVERFEAAMVVDNITR